MTIDELRPLTKETGNGLFLSCHVQPGASKTKVVGGYGAALKIALAAPPVDGKANKELCIFLSKLLKIPKSSICISSGLTSKNKTVMLFNVSLERLSVVLENISC